jgi:hypothetical protein
VDVGAAHLEEEFILPPFALFEPVKTRPLLVPMPQVMSASVVKKLAAAWKTPVDTLRAEMQDRFTILSIVVLKSGWGTVSIFKLRQDMRTWYFVTPREWNPSTCTWNFN